MASATAVASAVDTAAAKRGWGGPGVKGVTLQLQPAPTASAPIMAMIMRGHRRPRVPTNTSTSPDLPQPQLPTVVHPGRYDEIRSATDGDCPVELALRSTSGLSRGSGLGAPSSPTSSSSEDSFNESSGDVVRGRVSFSGDGWAEGAWATCSSGRLKIGLPVATAAAPVATAIPAAQSPEADGPPSVSAWPATPMDLTESRRRIVEVADRLSASPRAVTTVVNPAAGADGDSGACGDARVHTAASEPIAALQSPVEDSCRATDTDADATDEEEMVAEMAKWEAETAADGEEAASVKDEEDDTTDGNAEGGPYGRPCSGSSARYGSSEDGALQSGGVISRFIRRVRGDGGDALLRTRKEPHPSRKRRIVRVRRQRDDALVRLSAGFRCRTGWEPLAGLDKTNQDAVMLLLPFGTDDRSSLFGVLDGHGRHGHHVSFFIARQLETRIAAGINAGLPIDGVFRSACAGADARLMATAPFDTDMSGSTAVFVLVRDDDLYVGNVGDSRAVLGRVVPPRPRRLPSATRSAAGAVVSPTAFSPSASLPEPLMPAPYFGSAVVGQSVGSRRHTPSPSPSADGCSATLSEVSSTLSMTICSSASRTASAGGTPVCSGFSGEPTRRQRWRAPHHPLSDKTCKVDSDRLVSSDLAVRTTSARTEDGTGTGGVGSEPRKHTLSALSPRVLLRSRDSSPVAPPPAASATAVVPSNVALSPAADMVASLLPPSPPRYEAVGLSWDHKPSRPDERKRILAAGGRVERWNATALQDPLSESEASVVNPVKGGETTIDGEVTTVSTMDTPPPPADDEEEEDSAIAGPERVWLSDRRLPGLALSRAFGDGVAKSVGVTAEPDVTHLRLTPSDSFVILASDGVWDWVPSSEAVRFVGARRQRKEPPQAVAEALVRLAARRWAVRDAVTDDITAVVVFFDHGMVEGGDGGGLGRRAEIGAGRWTPTAVTPNEVERMLPPLPQPVFEPPRSPLIPEALDPLTASTAAPASAEEGYAWTT